MCQVPSVAAITAARCRPARPIASGEPLAAHLPSTLDVDRHDARRHLETFTAMSPKRRTGLVDGRPWWDSDPASRCQSGKAAMNMISPRRHEPEGLRAGPLSVRLAASATEATSHTGALRQRSNRKL